MENKFSTMENLVNPSRKFWSNKKVFITGHTGFKGTWLSIWLSYLGATLKGYALEPVTNPSIFYKTGSIKNLDNQYNDICNFEALEKSINEFNPDIVFHLAAQPLVLESYKDPISTLNTNIIGTANVLEISKKLKSIRAVVNVTSDKCYENKEWGWGYREIEPMGGYDPYSVSKGCSELITSAYKRSFYDHLGKGLASARAGNVIGGGDWSENRLIPDILRSMEDAKKLLVRSPTSVRPWQHVLEPICGYMILAEKLFEEPKAYSEGWNFGPFDDSCKSVEWICNTMSSKTNNKFSWGVGEQDFPHEANFLKLDISKAVNKLHWRPKLSLETSLSWVLDWNDAFLSNIDLEQKCISQIDEYTNLPL